MSEKVLSALSMARGAGKLKIGFEAAKDAVFAGAPLAVVTADLSPRSLRGVQRFCEEGYAELLQLNATQDSIAAKFGWRFGVAAVTDENFAALVKQQAQRERKQEDRA